MSEEELSKCNSEGDLYFVNEVVSQLISSQTCTPSSDHHQQEGKSFTSIQQFKVDCAPFLEYIEDLGGLPLDRTLLLSGESILSPLIENVDLSVCVPSDRVEPFIFNDNNSKLKEAFSIERGAVVENEQERKQRKKEKKRKKKEKEGLLGSDGEKKKKKKKKHKKKHHKEGEVDTSPSALSSSSTNPGTSTTTTTTTTLSTVSNEADIQGKNVD